MWVELREIKKAHWANMWQRHPGSVMAMAQVGDTQVGPRGRAVFGA